MKARVRPSRGMSAFGMAAGLLFVLLGFLVAIPTFGTVGWIWTGVAALITLYHAVNTLSDRGVSQMEVDVELPGRASGDAASIEDRLAKLAELRARGVITQDEEEQQRREILREV